MEQLLQEIQNLQMREFYGVMEVRFKKGKIIGIFLRESLKLNEFEKNKGTKQENKSLNEKA